MLGQTHLQEKKFLHIYVIQKIIQIGKMIKRNPLQKKKFVVFTLGKMYKI